MSAKAISMLLQQGQGILDKVAPKINEEVNKKIGDIKQKIPTEESIKQMMMDEITSKGPELVCSIEVRNRIDSIYNKMKSLMEKLQLISTRSNDKLLKLQEQLQKIGTIMAIIDGIFRILRALVPILQTIVILSGISLLFLKGPMADGASTIKLSNLINKSISLSETIDNALKVQQIKINEITKKVLLPMGIVVLAIKIISQIKISIPPIIGLIESYYLQYTLMCNIEGESMDDEDYAIAVNDAQNTLDDINSKWNLQDPNGRGDLQSPNGRYAELTLIESDLLPNTIEIIKNANFQVIRYRIA
jgi:hypothetical protein